MGAAFRCRQQGRTGRESNIGSIREDTQARRAGKQVRGLGESQQRKGENSKTVSESSRRAETDQ